MSSVFSFDAMIIFGALSVLLLVGLLLRAKMNFLQKFFVPACIIAGLLGLAVRSTGVMIGILPEGTIILETFVYHIFNITFISLGLTPGVKNDNKSNGKLSGLRSITGMGLLIASVAALQFILGGLFVILFNILGYNLFPTFGFLVTMGFEQGPGQALSIGKSWEVFGFANAATIGLSFATLGFIFAIFLGVPLVGRAIRKGKISIIGKEIPTSFKTGLFAKDEQNEIAGIHTIHPATLDSLSFHVALVGIVYLLTYGFLKVLELFTPADIAEMYWGFFFVWGLLIAYLVKILLKKIRVDYLLDRELQGRITGIGVDYLIVAAITAISLKVLLDYAVPILAIAASTGVITLLWIFYFGKRLWRKYTFERTIGVYGMETGTIATGLMLIRIVDPEFRTPAATDLALSGIIVLPIMFAMFHFMNAPILLGWSVELTVLVFLIFLIGIMSILTLLGMLKSPKKQK